jgi:hypothetical protein
MKEKNIENINDVLIRIQNDIDAKKDGEMSSGRSIIKYYKKEELTAKVKLYASNYGAVFYLTERLANSPDKLVKYELQEYYKKDNYKEVKYQEPILIENPLVLKELIGTLRFNNEVIESSYIYPMEFYSRTMSNGQLGGSNNTYAVKTVISNMFLIDDGSIDLDDPKMQDKETIADLKVTEKLITDKQRKEFIDKHKHLSNEEKKILFSELGLSKLDDMTQTQFKELIK